MARLRPVRTRPPKLLAKAGKVTHVLTFEETTRFAHFFNLLVEIDVRLPKTTKPKVKAKAEKCEVPKGKQPTSPLFRQGCKGQARLRRPGSITKKPCCIKCPVICNALGTAWWDLFLNPFIRIFNGIQINSMGYNNDRHHSFIAYT